jgi:hypothetical protein
MSNELYSEGIIMGYDTTFYWFCVMINLVGFVVSLPYTEKLLSFYEKEDALDGIGTLTLNPMMKVLLDTISIVTAFIPYYNILSAIVVPFSFIWIKRITDFIDIRRYTYTPHKEFE